MRELEMSAKTVEAAVQAACEALGVDRDDLNVSYEVLAFPEKKLFRSVPAKVLVRVEEPEAEAAPAAPAPAAPAPAAPAKEPAPTPAPEKAPAPGKAPSAPAAPAAPAPETEARVQAAIDYLTPIFGMLGAEDVAFTVEASGEAVLLHVTGAHLGALIGRRGETMESLGYLASLVVNRTEGPYIKLGLDVGGYRQKREADLAALATRIAERVRRTGYSYEMEPMNPYERHIVHTAVGAVEGVRSESKGEGPERRVVVYSTDPSASNLPDRGGYRPGRPRNDRGPRNYGDRGPRPHNDRNGRGARPGRGPRPERGARGRGPRPSNVPEREFAGRTWDPDTAPTVPGRSERIHDGDEFAFGKIDL